MAGPADDADGRGQGYGSGSGPGSGDDGVDDPVDDPVDDRGGDGPDRRGVDRNDGRPDPSTGWGADRATDRGDGTDERTDGPDGPNDRTVDPRTADEDEDDALWQFGVDDEADELPRPPLEPESISIENALFVLLGALLTVLVIVGTV